MICQGLLLSFLLIIAVGEDLISETLPPVIGSLDILDPTVFVTFFARNKAHTLPTFLGFLETQNYPKDRMSLWIVTDHNSDETHSLLQQWVEAVRPLYHSIQYRHDDTADKYSNESGPFDWTSARYRHLIDLKEESLQAARDQWADYILFLDCDNFLIHTDTLRLLIAEQKDVVAPLLKSLSRYSNFWAGMTDSGYYLRTDDYGPIYERERLGCFAVPMVHGTVLISLKVKSTMFLTFDYKKIPDYAGPEDDIIVFARSVQLAGLQMFVLNTEEFGVLLEPVDPEELNLQSDVENMKYLQMEALYDGPPGLYTSPVFGQLSTPLRDKLGFDEVYLINLERRSERFDRMTAVLDLLHVDFQWWPAVDGKTIDEGLLLELGITMMPEYRDPYHGRPMTHGEIGCFLSHYRIWEDMLSRGLKKVLVFEDDLRFVHSFRGKLEGMMDEAGRLAPEWDLIYLGRKRMATTDGPMVDGAKSLGNVGYSYWTLAYALTYEGASKLLSAEPLKNLLPVDEYLPIMFDHHPNAVWKSHFPKRKLKAFTAEPLLVFPTHYTGENGYISDTENTTVVSDVVSGESFDAATSQTELKTEL